MPAIDPTPLYGEAGGALNVDPLLLQAIGNVESGGEPDPDKAVSSAGALGRMQVMPPNLTRYNVSDPTDPRQNIYAGAAVLDEALTAANGNVPLALRIYQGGQDQTKWGPNNAAYPGKVAAAYQALAQRAGPAQGAPAAPAAPASQLDATDAFLTGGPGAGAAKTAEAKPDATDDFLTGKGSTPPSAATEQPTMLKTGTMSANLPSLPGAGSIPIPTGPGMDALPSESPGAAGPDRLGGAPNSAPTTTLNQPTTGPLPGPIRRIGQAVSDAWNAPNPLMSPKGEQILESGGPGTVGYQITSPLLQAGGAVLRGAGALGAGASAVLGEGGNAISPGLGRDLNLLAQVAPFARVGTGLPLTPGAATEAPAPGPRFVSEHYAPAPVPGGNALDRINQLLTHDDAERAGNGPQTQTNLLAPTAALQVVPPGGQNLLARGPDGAVGAPASAVTGVPKTAAEAKSVASAYYDKAERDGGTLTPEFANKFVDAAKRIAPQSEAGMAVSGQTPVTALAGRLEALRDKPISLQAAQEIDESLSGLIDKEYGMKGLSKDGKSLLDLQSDFREMIRNAGPDDITGGTSGFDSLAQGRKAWSQAMKMDDLERIQQRAEGTDNPATGIKSGIRTLLNNRSRVRGYSDDEIAALEQAQNRGVIGGAMHVFGSRLIPQAAAVGGFFGSGPLAAVVAGTTSHFAGSALRAGATRLQSNRLTNALETLGKGVPPNPLNPN